MTKKQFTNLKTNAEQISEELTKIHNSAKATRDKIEQSYDFLQTVTPGVFAELVANCFHAEIIDTREKDHKPVPYLYCYYDLNAEFKVAGIDTAEYTATIDNNHLFFHSKDGYSQVAEDYIYSTMTYFLDILKNVKTFFAFKPAFAEFTRYTVGNVGWSPETAQVFLAKKPVHLTGVWKTWYETFLTSLDD